MASETTTTQITEIVPAERISDLVMAYAIDAMVAAPLCREVMLPGGAGKIFNFVQSDKDTAADVTEGNTMSNDAFTLSETAVTIATVGILRSVTKLASRTNQLGEAGLLQLLIDDASMLIAEMIDDDIVGLFGSITRSVGTSGSDLTIANCVAAIAGQRTGKARGEMAFVFDDQQQLDLMTAVVGSTATPFVGANQSILNGRLDGLMGTFLGIPAYVTNLTETANAGADVVGALVVNGQTNPSHASLGLVIGWGPEMTTETPANLIGKLHGFDAAYGVGLVGDGFSTKIVTDA
jgi:hypothetical protein